MHISLLRILHIFRINWIICFKFTFVNYLIFDDLVVDTIYTTEKLRINLVKRNSTVLSNLNWSVISSINFVSFHLNLHRYMLELFKFHHMLFLICGRVIHGIDGYILSMIYLSLDSFHQFHQTDRVAFHIDWTLSEQPF